MIISPEDVLLIDSSGKFPLYIRNAWRVYKAEDPVEAAKKSIAGQKKMRIQGASILASVGIVAITAAWYVLSRNFPAVWPSLPLWQKAAWVTGVLLSAIFTLLASGVLTVPGAPHDYANKRDEFGQEFASLLYLLGFDTRLGNFLKLTQKQTREVATTILTQQAVKVLESEKINAEHRSRRLEEGWAPSHDEDHARNRFRSDFALVKKFDLANPAGWGPYFEAAKTQPAKM